MLMPGQMQLTAPQMRLHLMEIHFCQVKQVYGVAGQREAMVLRLIIQLHQHHPCLLMLQDPVL